MQPKIILYNDTFKLQVLKTWEDSVLATHHFLSKEDFISIKTIVQTIDFSQFPVYCLVQENDFIGFIGVADNKVEMLFIHPQYFGKGYGTLLMKYAINELSADKVDVNEQNNNAVKFYKKLGFETYERTDKDDQGNDYPLLRMKIMN